MYLIPENFFKICDAFDPEPNECPFYWQYPHFSKLFQSDFLFFSTTEFFSNQFNKKGLSPTKSCTLLPKYKKYYSDPVLSLFDPQKGFKEFFHAPWSQSPFFHAKFTNFPKKFISMIFFIHASIWATWGRKLDLLGKTAFLTTFGPLELHYFESEKFYKSSGILREVEELLSSYFQKKMFCKVSANRTIFQYCNLLAHL